METTTRDGGDDDINMMDHTLEIASVEDGNVGASIMNNTLGVPLEIGQMYVKIGTSDAKIEVCEEEESRKDDKVIGVGEDDDQSSGENDAGLLGRGRRKSVNLDLLSARLSQILQKNKKTNVTQFDAYRVVDTSKKDDLDKWLEKVVESEELSLPFCNVSRKFFDDLLGEKWLMSDHIDIALYHIRERAAQYPQLFNQNSCILDTRFLGLMTENKKKIDKLSILASFFKNNQHETSIGRFVRYVDDRSPILGKAWKGCRFLYIPCCINGHWIAIRVDIKERKIEVYNSLGGQVIHEEIFPIEIALPKQICSTVDESYGLQRLRVENIACPQQPNGFDYGMFTVKYIEFLLAGKDVSLIRPDYMGEWRKKLSANIFLEHFDP
ncbi:hypothetical protein ACS0TY_013403 [Phlomoides rotata]